jgi:heme iron utilization protein
MSVPDETVATARALAAGDRAALATLDSQGWPYVSLVLVAQDERGQPLLLLSDLAEHTKNIKRDGRASLLFDGTAGVAEPLAGPRLTVMGRIEPAPEAADLALYLARHPGAEAWAAMRDFRLYRLVPTRGHLVAGFGRIAWIEATALFLPAH